MSEVIKIRVKRQDNPDSKPFWDEFEVPYKPSHNIVSLLMALR